MNIQFPDNEHINLYNIKPNICYQCVESNKYMFDENSYYLFILDEQNHYYTVCLKNHGIIFMGEIDFNSLKHGDIVTFRPVTDCVINL